MLVLVDVLAQRQPEGRINMLYVHILPLLLVRLLQLLIHQLQLDFKVELITVQGLFFRLPQLPWPVIVFTDQNYN